jgi:hypothetical protein
LTLAHLFAGVVQAQPEGAGPLDVGDIDGDGRRDAALVVERAVGGLLAEVYVVLMAEGSAGWRPLATMRLDDGAEVERLRIVPGRLTASYRRHYPVDRPGNPTHETVRSWAYADGGFHGAAPARVPPDRLRAVAERLSR